ncbi:hypothetical protein [Polaromonas sp.]|uniref:hypothetical protein n=1 Tax=Polaromonas sp. TaxID=1869339 RepID=UPI003BABCB19
MLPINPLALYSVPFFAREIAHIHPVTVYQSLAGLKNFPLPVATKIGRTVRFKGDAILAWRDALPTYGAASVPAVTKIASINPLASMAEKKRRGRPTKAAQIAGREATAARLTGGTT